MDHVKGEEKLVQLLLLSFFPVKQWLGMNMILYWIKTRVSLLRDLFLTAVGTYRIRSCQECSDFSCVILWLHSLLQSLFHWIQALEMCGGVLRIWFYFQWKLFKIQNKYYKGLWQYRFFFTWKWDLISSSNNLQVKIAYGNHTQSFFSMFGQKTKANYTTWFYPVRANNKINQGKKCYNKKRKN